jgi:S-adenosyl-L-methionine hydrolase (adenosine-forming)
MRGYVPVVGLVTDFGRVDSYVAEMHAAIVRCVPAVRIVDVTHDVSPFDGAGTALVVERALAQLPRGAALVVVVDPGVGTSRSRIAVHINQRWCVGPDNGTLPVTDASATNVWRIERVVATPGVSTFDGREVFGPVGALLAAGADPRLLGARHTKPQRWLLPNDAILEVVGRVRYARGVVFALDRYGNAVTNIRLPENVNRTKVHVVEPEAFAGPLRNGYGDVARGERLALIGSSGRLELAISQKPTAVVVGEEVVVRCDD